MITIHGKIDIPAPLIAAAELIKHENYKVTKPGQYKKHCWESDFERQMVDSLANLVNVSPQSIDWVFFSAASGAEEHIDQLPDNFDDHTFMIPIIVPKGESVLYAGDASVVVKPNAVYQFDHTVKHSMTVEDERSGCVLIMATEVHDV